MARTNVRLYYGVAVPCFLNKKSGESMRHKDYSEPIAQRLHRNAFQDVLHMKQFGYQICLSLFQLKPHKDLPCVEFR
jgi:hypothetical protein